MLREDYTYVSKELERLIGEFVGFTVTGDVTITSYRRLSPDSFVWRLRIGSSVYFLYAEDYIPSMDHVRAAVSAATNGSRGEFVKVRSQDDFADHPPVKTAAVYQEPDDWDEIRKYAASSGHDSVFLFKVAQSTKPAKGATGG